MDELIRSVEDHRLDREAGAIVYPVISRRARGLSVGINLFPDRKICSFDCPYCEVFPFQTDITFSLQAMERGLREVAKRLQRGGMAEAVRDLSFSGNGEPTMHPDFISALTLAACLRHELFEVHQPEVKLVLITNGTGLMDTKLASFLARAARGEAPYFDAPHSALEIWLKLDAGTEFWYEQMNRSAIPLAALHEAIKAFSLKAPFIIQTMICKVDGELPPEEEVTAWEGRIRELVARAPIKDGPQTGPQAGPQSGPQAVHLYSKARPAPEDPKTEAVEEAYLAKRRDSLQKALAPYRIPIEVFV
jgi:histidinol dehydrogenase